eukprot:205493-Prymnesium_polylepis.1
MGGCGSKAARPMLAPEGTVDSEKDALFKAAALLEGTFVLGGSGLSKALEQLANTSPPPEDIGVWLITTCGWKSPTRAKSARDSWSAPDEEDDEVPEPEASTSLK